MNTERPRELQDLPAWERLLSRLTDWMVAGFAIGALAFAVIHERIL